MGTTRCPKDANDRTRISDVRPGARVATSHERPARAERYSGIPAIRNAAEYSLQDSALKYMDRARSLACVRCGSMASASRATCAASLSRLSEACSQQPERHRITGAVV